MIVQATTLELALVYAATVGISILLGCALFRGWIR